MTQVCQTSFKNLYKATYTFSETNTYSHSPLIMNNNKKKKPISTLNDRR